MCHGRDERFTPYGLEEYVDFVDRLNCSDLNWKNETHPIDERLHCYLDETNIYGVNTNVLNKYIFTNHENIHAQRGFDCVKRGLETSKPGYCDYTYDTEYCIRQTPADTYVFLACSQICHGNTTHNYTMSDNGFPKPEFECPLFGGRYCNIDGVWDPFTNYDQCESVTSASPWYNETLFYETLQVHAGTQLEYDDLYGGFASILHHIILWPLIASILCLVVAFFLFLNRRLRCTRVIIHQNLILAWILKYVATLFQALAFLNLDNETAYNRSLQSEDPTIDPFNALKESFLQKPTVLKTLNILENLFFVAGSTWFFLEAVFLQYQISMNVFGSTNALKLKHIIAVGWLTPLVLSIPWIIMTDLHYQNMKGDKLAEYHNGETSGEEYMKFLHAIDTWQSIRDINEIFWIAVPQLIMLLLNFVMLLNIVRIIVSKVRVTASNDYEVFKKSLYATLSLVPLFGLSFILGFISLDEKEMGVYGHIQTSTTIILGNGQGIFIATIYCFMNKDVQRRVKEKFQRAAERHSSAFYSRGTEISTFSSMSESISSRWTKTIKRVSERSRFSRNSQGQERSSRNEGNSILDNANSDSYSNLEATSI